MISAITPMIATPAIELLIALMSLKSIPKDLQVKINNKDERYILLNYGGWRYL